MIIVAPDGRNEMKSCVVLRSPNDHAGTTVDIRKRTKCPNIDATFKWDLNSFDRLTTENAKPYVT